MPHAVHKQTMVYTRSYLYSDFRDLVGTVRTWTLRVILQLNSPNQSRHKEWERKSAFALCMQRAAYSIGLTVKPKLQNSYLNQQSHAVTNKSRNLPAKMAM